MCVTNTNLELLKQLPGNHERVSELLCVALHLHCCCFHGSKALHGRARLRSFWFSNECVASRNYHHPLLLDSSDRGFFSSRTEGTPTQANANERGDEWIQSFVRSFAHSFGPCLLLGDSYSSMLMLKDMLSSWLRMF